MDLTLFHAPQTRSSGILVLLEELGAPYTLHVLNMKAGEQRAPAFLRINPMGKVPAILHGDALVTEQAAISIYLADLFPERQLAPTIDSALRGPYLRWMVFYGSSFEPAVIDRALKREAGSAVMSPYGDYDRVLETIRSRLQQSPYLLGETISAADILWGTALNWTTMFGLVPEAPEIRAYIERVTGRPAFAKVTAQDRTLAAAHDSAAKASAVALQEPT